MSLDGRQGTGGGGGWRVEVGKRGVSVQSIGDLVGKGDLWQEKKEEGEKMFFSFRPSVSSSLALFQSSPESVASDVFA